MLYITMKPTGNTLGQLEVLQEQAHDVLRHNDRGSFVTPSDELYGAGGNNWGYLWDTAFAAIAIASYDPDRARKLFENYVSLQHPSGMLPHMGMWSSGGVAGKLATNWNWHAWRFKQQDVKGDIVKTSPITQPPMLAIAAGEIVDKLPSEHFRYHFAHVAAKRLVKHHAWLYKDREVEGSGLVQVIHPHETGRDDAPSHVDLLHAVTPTVVERIWLSGASKRIFSANRTDRAANPDERSATDTVMRAAALALFRLPEIYRQHGRVPTTYPYRHIDPGFNAILDRANDELLRLASIGKVAVPITLQKAMQRTTTGLQDLWDGSAQAFRGIDLNGQVTFTPGEEIGDMLPIVSRNITLEQRAAIIQRLIDPLQFGGDNVPSVSRNSKRYDADRFWQGADWPPMRMLIIDGLMGSGDEFEWRIAQNMVRSVLQQTHNDGKLPEYRDGTTGEAKGAANFTWCAALICRVLQNLDAPIAVGKAIAS